MKKKHILLAVSGFAVMLAVVGSIYAILIADDETPNHVTVGEDIITVEEGTTDFVPPDDPNDPFRKLVQITNKGNIPCYVRVAIEFSDDKIRDITYFSYENPNAEETPSVSDESWKLAKITDDSDSEYFINDLPDGWVYITESGDILQTEDAETLSDLGGYFYYTKPVAAGKSTDALIAWVRTAFETDADMVAYDIFVYSESVQTVEAATGEEYKDYLSAWKSILNANQS